MDKRAIANEIRQRNQLRREAHLPLLDERQELARAIQTAALSEYQEFCDRFADVRQRFVDEVLAERLQETGRDYSQTAMGMWSVRHTAFTRFRAWIAETYGVTWPPATDQEQRIAVARLASRREPQRDR